MNEENFREAKLHHYPITPKLALPLPVFVLYPISFNRRGTRRRTNYLELSYVDSIHAGEPVFEAGHPFFQELNPILSLLSFHRATVAGFLTNGAADLVGDFGGQRYQTQFVMFDSRTFESFRERPDFERGNAYRAPNSDDRDSAFGTIESFDCKPSGGEVAPSEGNPGCRVAGNQTVGGKLQGTFPHVEATNYLKGD